MRQRLLNNSQKKTLGILLAVFVCSVFIAGCSGKTDEQGTIAGEFGAETAVSEPETEIVSSESTAVVEFDIHSVPEYTGSAYFQVNGNTPYFTQDELTTSSYESYSELDALGRCGVCVACVGQDIMPTEKRGELGPVKPSGWHTVKYNGLVDGNYLYNRCHLLAYCLTGENANTQNLITGTRYMNTEGMEPFENNVADYVTNTNNHVMYRVTPIFEGDNLVADGVLMEGKSVEDDGAGILFCVFCYNVQPDIVIDYATGESSPMEGVAVAKEPTQKEQEVSQQTTQEEKQETVAAADNTENSVKYILNTNTKKFHYPECSSVNEMKEKNKKRFSGTRDEAIAKGYVPCKRCKP